MRTVVGVLSALGGRFGFLWWTPFALWLFYAAALRHFAMPGRYDQPGALLMLGAVPAALMMMWAWKARFALSLGYSREQVFAIGMVFTWLMIMASQFLLSAASLVELRLVGEEGFRVFALDVSSHKGESAGWATFIQMLYLIYLISLFFVALITVLWVLRFKVAGLLVAPVALALYIALLLVAGPIFDLNTYLACIVFLALHTGLAAGLGWVAFRRQPV